MKRMTVLALALLGAAAGASANGVPPDIAAKLRELGRVVDPPATAKIYAPMQQAEPYAGVTVARDLAYGAHARHRLDVFAPEGGGGARPVLMFVHGGAFTAGNKRAPGSPFYDNVVLWAARNGMVGVNMTYRLAPEHRWPAGAEDVGAAVRWVRDNIAGRGGDPARIFLMGHSAGAVHVASYVAHPRFHAAGGSGLAGALLISGLFDITANPGPPEKIYFGEDDSLYRERSSLAGLLETPLPLLVAYAELDPPPFVRQAQQLNEALCKAKACPKFVELAKHSHMSEVYAINTEDVSLTDAVVGFVRTGR